MITKDDVIQKVGAEQYWLASNAAKNSASSCESTAPGLGSKKDAKFVTEIAHKINDILAADDPAAYVDPTPRQLPVILEIYRDIPDYAFLSVCYMHYVNGQYSQAEIALLWTTLREFLGSEDGAIAGPADYVVCVDLFENPETASEAWKQLLAEPQCDRLVCRVLRNSGPISTELKFKIYDELLSDERWHLDIFESIFGSEFDIYGQLDTTDERQHARDILNKLKIERDNVRYSLLSKSLSEEVRYCERQADDASENIDCH
jgi:hypothetical protein